MSKLLTNCSDLDKSANEIIQFCLFERIFTKIGTTVSPTRHGWFRVLIRRAKANCIHIIALVHVLLVHLRTCQQMVLLQM